jgi:hypothetical protein
MPPEIATLSRHLQHNLQSLRGRVARTPQHFSPALLIPVAAIVGVSVLLTISPKARKSLLLKVAMLVSTHLLQEQNERLDNEIEGDERKKKRRESGDNYHDPSKN